MLFCQNDSPMRGSFWLKENLITHILFELQPIIIFSPVANFGDQSLLFSSDVRIKPYIEIIFIISKNLDFRIGMYFFHDFYL
jgi:hypothetical protein